MKKRKLVNYLKTRNNKDKELRDEYFKENNKIMFNYVSGECDFNSFLIRLIEDGEFD